MRRVGLLLLLTWTLTLSVFGERREVHILSVNDMHAKIEAFPKLAAIADSLRKLYPSLLVLSAGDNQTGNALSDMYRVPSYPMVALMNQVGFHATTLGNHEFDLKSLPRLMGVSHFSYICANIHPEPEAGIHIIPKQVFDVEGVKVGIIGVVQVNEDGRPTTHPDNVKHMTFSQPLSTVAQYESFSRECDVTVLLSHIGYNADIEMAHACPWLDLIIGGHTHTQLTADNPLHNGVLITQNRNRLPQVTHITVTVEDGRVVDKRAEYISVWAFTQKNSLVETMVSHFSENPYFKQIVGYAETPFRERDQITFMMCDAFLSEIPADISIVNNGGVRVDSLAAGNITLKDVFSIDPFGNETVELKLTGKEVQLVLMKYSHGSLYHLPRVGGIVCEATVDKNDPNKNKLKSIRLKNLDGKKLDLRKTYTVVTNSYVSAIFKSYIKTNPHTLNIKTSKALINYLEKQARVNYEHVDRLIVKEK